MIIVPYLDLWHFLISDLYPSFAGWTWLGRYAQTHRTAQGLQRRGLSFRKWEKQRGWLS